MLRLTPQFSQLCRALPVSRHICTARVYGVLQTYNTCMYTACVLRKARGKILNIINSFQAFVASAPATLRVALAI